MLRPFACSALLLAACTKDAPTPPTPPIAAPTISHVAETTFVTTAASALDDVASLVERWQQVPDAERFGEITDGVLGATGAIWFAVAGGTDRAAIYRADPDTPLRAVADLGTSPGEVTGPVALAALADGGVIVVERASGRALRLDSLGVATDTFTVAPPPADRGLVPDRDGGWFAPLAASEAWLHYTARGAVTDTVRPSSGWDTNATIGIARDGSWLRAVIGTSQLARRAGDGPILTVRWIGDALAGTLHVAHDAHGLAWVGARTADGTTRLRGFDRDGRLRFTAETPSGSVLLDHDGELLLLLGRDGVLRVLEVVHDSR